MIRSSKAARGFGGFITSVPYKAGHAIRLEAGWGEDAQQFVPSVAFPYASVHTAIF